MSVIINPIEQYFNLDGSPLENGYLYFGEAFGNPITEPVTVYFDPAFTIPAAQPVRTVNGYPVRSGTATGLFAPDDVSILVQNSAKEQVIYIESSSVSAVQTNTFYRDSNQLLTADDNNKIFIATLPFTQAIDASVALGATWAVQYVNMSNGLIVFDPNLSETIDGQTTVSLQPNHSIFIRCDGVNLTSTSSPYPVQSLASTPALDLTVTKSKLINITGVASITSISMVNGDVIKAIASGAFTLVNSSGLIVQGAANYTATANDIFTFSRDSAGNVHVEIQKIDGRTIAINNSISQLDTNITITDAGSGKIETTIDGVITEELTTAARKSTIDGGSTLYPEFKCRAFANWNAIGTLSVRASGNVSSITDNGTGDFTINLTSMPDANYSVGTTTSNDQTSAPILSINGAPTISAIRIFVTNNAGTKLDNAYNNIQIFR